MLEALWSVQFISNVGGSVGGGVAIFETGRVFGGDSQYYYLGTCEVKGNVAHVDVTVTHYFGPMSSVFGPIGKFSVKLSGAVQKQVMELEGFLVENPALRIRARLTRRAELP